MSRCLKIEVRRFLRTLVGLAIQSTKIHSVSSVATGKLLSASRWSNRRYAVLRASHSYLVADFFLTLLLDLYAALSHVRAGKSHVLNLRRENSQKF